MSDKGKNSHYEQGEQQNEQKRSFKKARVNFRAVNAGKITSLTRKFSAGRFYARNERASKKQRQTFALCLSRHERIASKAGIRFLPLRVKKRPV